MRDFVSEYNLLQMQFALMRARPAIPAKEATRAIIATLVKAAKNAQLAFEKQANIVSFDTKARMARKARYEEQSRTRRQALAALSRMEENEDSLVQMSFNLANAN